ncbi:MAG TPA: hypothetical protein VK843_18930 [Planctomycetota bacterium]|nr:hypothetical protein [Planctomycetota bacterium]
MGEFTDDETNCGSGQVVCAAALIVRVKSAADASVEELHRIASNRISPHVSEELPETALDEGRRSILPQNPPDARGDFGPC